MKQEQNTLLLALEIVIKQNGGNEKYADAIEREWLTTSRRKIDKRYQDWTPKEVSILLRNYGKKDRTELCAILGRTEAAIRKKYSYIMKSTQKYVPDKDMYVYNFYLQ